MTEITRLLFEMFVTCF